METIWLSRKLFLSLGDSDCMGQKGLPSTRSRSLFLWRSAARQSLRFLQSDSQTGMYGSPLHRQRCMSPKSTSITRASPQCHDFRCNRDTAVVWKFARLLNILVAAGIDNRVHLTRIHAPHCTHGGAGPTTQFDSQTGFTLPLVLHQPCPRFGNDQRLRNNNWRRMCTPMLVDPRTTRCRSARTIAGYIHCPTQHCSAHNPRVSPHHLVQLARAQSRAIAGEHRSEMSAQLQQELRHDGCTQCIAIARANATTARWFCRQNLMKRGVVKPHLIENKNSYEYPRAGNEQTIGRQRVGIPLEPRLPESPESTARFGSLGPIPICSKRR